MKIDRLIGIVTILLRQDRVTAPELAQRFEVSRRTINRDIETLCKAGIPLVTTQGYGGGITIADGYKIDKTLLSEEELQTLLAGLTGMNSISQATSLSLLAEKLSNRAGQVTSDGVIVIDLASHYQEPLTQKISSIKQAILNKQRISFQYYYEKGNHWRTVEPYRLLFKWSSWYVLGYCLFRNDFRLFKLNRLWKLEVCPDSFVPRSIPSEKWNFGDYLEAGTFHLKALFAESEAYRLIEEYGIGSYTTDPNGRVVFEWDFTSYSNMRAWIQSFGDRVEVLAPETLREELCRQARNLLKMYGQS